MNKKRVLVERAANAKIVFRGVVVEIKKLSDKEVEITFPESVNYKELISFLENFGTIRRKFSPDPVVEEELETEKDKADQKEGQEKNEVIREEAGQEETEKGANEQIKESNEQTSSKKRRRRTTTS